MVRCGPLGKDPVKKLLQVFIYCSLIDCNTKSATTAIHGPTYLLIELVERCETVWGYQ